MGGPLYTWASAEDLGLGPRGFAFGGLFIMVVFAAMVGLAVVTVVWWWRTRRGQAAAMPLCGQCGYCVRGVPTFTCPECGADLREVGIVGPHARRGPNVWLPILVWTVLLPFVAIVLTLVLTRLVPQQRRPFAQRTIFCQFPDQPDMLPPTITVRMDGQRWRWPWSSAPVPYESMRLYFADPLRTDFHVDRTTGACWHIRPDGQSLRRLPGGLGVDSLLDWFASAGLEVESELARQAAADILLAIEETPQARGKFTKLSPDPQTGTERITAHPADVFVRRLSALETDSGIIGVLVFWSLVWVLGIWLIVRRQRRRMEAASAHPTREA